MQAGKVLDIQHVGLALANQFQQAKQTGLFQTVAGAMLYRSIDHDAAVLSGSGQNGIVLGFQHTDVSVCRAGVDHSAVRGDRQRRNFDTAQRNRL